MKNRKKNCLVTGGSGFIGSHLCEHLLAQGHVVQVIDDLSTGSLDNIAHLLGNANFHFARSSVRDIHVLDRMASMADVVIHLAAAVGVQLIIDRPVHSIETNILGAEAVLKAALRYNCRILLCSTSEVYGKGVSFPFREQDDVLLGPTDKSRWAYAASKMIDEYLGYAYAEEFGLSVSLVRLFNTVGPRQTGQYGMVIPRFVRQALTGEPITVYGDGSQSRCFCDVRDVVQAIALLVDREEALGQLFNVGTDNEISMLDLAVRIKEMTRSPSPITLVPYAQAYGKGFEDMQRRLPCIDKIRRMLGWSPTIPLEETLEAVIAHERRQPTPPGSNPTARP